MIREFVGPYATMVAGFRNQGIKGLPDFVGADVLERNQPGYRLISIRMIIFGLKRNRVPFTLPKGNNLRDLTDIDRTEVLHFQRGEKRLIRLFDADR